MLVDDVAAEGDVHGDRDSQLERPGHHADVPVGQVCLHDAPSQGLAEARAVARRLRRRLVQRKAGLRSHAEASVMQHRRHVLGGRPHGRHLPVVDGARSVQGDRRDRPLLEELHHHWPQPDLDHVRAHGQDHGPFLLPGRNHGIGEVPERLGTEDPGQPLQEHGERSVPVHGRGELIHGDLVRALGQRIRAHAREIGGREAIGHRARG
jgi:hypothetical protein